MKKFPITTAVLGLVALVLVGAYITFYVANQNLLAETMRLRALVLESKNNVGHVSAPALAGEELAGLNKYVVTEDRVPTFLSDIEGRGRSVGATITVASVEPEKNTTGKLRVSLAISGNFSAVMQTLGLIEYAPYGLSTSAVTLNKSGTQWQAEMIFTVLYAPTGSINNQ